MVNVTKLLSAFEGKSARIGVIGMGYVGYPMAVLAAQKGYTVVGIEVNEKRVDQINQGISYIQDVKSEEVKTLVENGKLSGTTEYSVVKDLDVVLITVPTPLNKTGDPDMGFVIQAADQMQEFLHPSMIISLESTTYPGSTEEILSKAVTDAGYVPGEDIFIAFSPERVDPGNKVYQTENTPKVVGGMTANCSEVATALYSTLVKHVIPVSSTTAAEMVKLYENTFRAINIGLVNELAIICNLLKIDVWEIVEAASTKPFGFMPFFPGPGLGGHCIPIDPSYLAWKMKSLQYKTRFIDLATEINTGMPVWVINRVATLLNEIEKSVKGSKIMILGLAYKADIDDLRESPALDVFRLLEEKGATVVYHDPYCPQAHIGKQTHHSLELTDETIREQDLVIITTGHSTVDYHNVLSKANMVFDTRNITRKIAEKYDGKVRFL